MSLEGVALPNNIFSKLTFCGFKIQLKKELLFVQIKFFLQLMFLNTVFLSAYRVG